MKPQHHLLPVDSRAPAPQAVSAQGIFIHDSHGKRYIDGCCGALVANIGHGLTEIAAAMARQTADLSYVYRVHFANPTGEALAARYCQLTDPPMGSAIFVNSGSEATETAVKLARAFHLARGQERRHQIISRWQSYHGITMGALSWTGLTARRADYQPYLKGCVHIPPAYCYRCWFGRNPDSCDLECAHALENAILTEGADTVSAFIIEPVVGSALAAATPPAEYFRVVRDICTRHGVLLIFDEVMTGAGRTGGRFFASDHLPGKPDILAFGKGVGGGYYPLGGALVSPVVADVLNDGPGGFTANQSH